MKKLYKGLIVLFLLLALVLGLSACKEEPAQQQEHEHTFSTEWTTNDTYHWHAATCEHTTEKADRAKHKWVTTITVEPTHTTAGEKITTCKVCGLSKTEVIPAETQVHAYSNTWEHDTNYHWHPTTCGHDAKGSFEPHTWDTVEVLTPATCDAEGTAQYTCKCGATKTEPIPRHTFATTWTSDDDYHWHAATCGHDAVSALEEHTWGSYIKNSNGTATYTCSICEKKVTKTLPTVISMVNTGPGEDASKGVVISWHSTVAGSYLEYTDANGDTFVNTVANAQCNEALSTAEWHEGVSANHYRCKVYLDNLTPDSTYKYRIRQGSTYSEVATFRTAETDTTYFQFMWMSDNHVPKGGETTLERIRELINYAQAKGGVDLDFVLFTGDMVNTGKYYEHWKYWSDSGLMNDITYAFVCGNHDYYDGTRNADGDKVRETNAYFKDVCAYPANNSAGGKSVLDSNYWFIWNRVLFVCVDNFTSEGALLSGQGRSVSDQIAWFKAVVEANEGKYDYLIFAQHLPWFNTDTAPCKYGYYSSWWKIFDDYKVDFALSSDEHTYRRTYPLYNNVKTDLVDGKVSIGTVYVTSSQTQGGSVSSLSNNAADDLKYVEYTGPGGEVTGVYFTVTPTEMTLHLIGANGKQGDTITVMKKDR